MGRLQYGREWDGKAPTVRIGQKIAICSCSPILPVDLDDEDPGIDACLEE